MVFYLNLCFIVNVMPFTQCLVSLSGLCFILVFMHLCDFIVVCTSFPCVAYIVCPLSVLLPAFANKDVHYLFGRPLWAVRCWRVTAFKTEEGASLLGRRPRPIVGRSVVECVGSRQRRARPRLRWATTAKNQDRHDDGGQNDASHHEHRD